MDTLKEAELTASIRHIAIFLKSHDYRFTIPKFRILHAEKREEGEEEKHWQLQSVIHFTQTQ